MQWVYDGEDWKAEGEKGDFLIWRLRRGFYKARYRTKDERFLFFIGFGSLEELKRRCENNYYWE